MVLRENKTKKYLRGDSHKMFARAFAREGFTLIEMLVVIFIIAAISSLILANFRVGQKRYALEQAANKVVSDLRQAQNMAISGSKKTTDTIYDYGIHFNNSESFYIIFADKQTDSQRYQSASDSLIEKINLPNQIKIQSVSPNSSGLDIVFEPPNPKTYINKSQSGPATITLQYGEDSTLTKTITITLAGLIYAD